MPIIEAAKKAMRSDVRKTLRNRQVRGTYRSAMKAFQLAIQNDDTTAAEESFKKAQKALAKAAQKNVIKKNTAARRTSRMNAALKALKQK